MVLDCLRGMVGFETRICIAGVCKAAELLVFGGRRRDVPRLPSKLRRNFLETSSKPPRNFLETSSSWSFHRPPWMLLDEATPRLPPNLLETSSKPPRNFLETPSKPPPNLLETSSELWVAAEERQRKLGRIGENFDAKGRQQR